MTGTSEEPPSDELDDAVTETIDARGLRCPLPVIRLAARAREAEPGQRIAVLATDPAARHDVPAWARMRGHEMLSTSRAEEVWTLTVRIGRSDT